MLRRRTILWFPEHQSHLAIRLYLEHPEFLVFRSVPVAQSDPVVQSDPENQPGPECR